MPHSCFLLEIQEYKRIIFYYKIIVETDFGLIRLWYVWGHFIHSIYSMKPMSPRVLMLICAAVLNMATMQYRVPLHRSGEFTLKDDEM